VCRHFKDVVVRGDSDFDRQDVLVAAQSAGAHFAVCGRLHANRLALAQSIPEQAWTPFVPRAERAQADTRQRQSRTPDCRQAAVQEKRWKNLRTTGQWLAEIPYHPAGLSKPCRMIVRRVRIEESRGQEVLFEHYRYRIVLTDLPRTHTPRQIIDLTYQRCDQENLIAQLGEGIAAWRMPVAEFTGNAVWLQIARLAWNMGKWIAQLALPEEVVRWQWKRFRQKFVYIAAKVIKAGRRIVVRLADSHPCMAEILAAHARMQV